MVSAAGSGASRWAGSNPYKISLVGPDMAGKTMLLATIQDCVRMRAVGYDNHLRLTLRSVDDEEPETSQRQARNTSLREGKFAKLRRDLVLENAEYTATLSSVFEEYNFDLTVSGDNASGKNLRRTIRISVTDTAGEHVSRGDLFHESESQTEFEYRKEFYKILFESHMIIFVIPVFPLKRKWINEIEFIFQEIVKSNSSINRKTILVIFSQYELAFTNFGPLSFAYASNPSVAEYVVRKTLEKVEVIKDLDVDAEVFVTVASSYGFLKDFGIPNVDPSYELAARFSSLQGVQSNPADGWMPFLTADPFLFPALGPSRFMFRLDDLLDGMRPRRRHDHHAPHPSEHEPEPDEPGSPTGPEMKPELTFLDAVGSSLKRLARGVGRWARDVFIERD